MGRFAALVIAILLLVAVLPGVASAQTPRPQRLSQADQYELTSQISEAMRYLTIDPERSLDDAARHERTQKSAALPDAIGCRN